MLDVPSDLKYTENHEWVRTGDDKEKRVWVEIGITDYAQESLGEIVFIELPSEGDAVTKGDSFGALESTKSVSAIYSPVSGEVIEVNEVLSKSPEQINEDPYKSGWIIKVRMDNPQEMNDLMEPENYTNFIESEME